VDGPVIDRQSLDRTFAKLRASELRELADYWLRQRGARPMPRRADIDPVDLPRHLPRLVLADVFYAPLRVRFRVVGTELERRLGYALTGHTIDAGSGAFFKPYELCAEQVRPTREYSRYDFGDAGPVGEFERLLLPLSEDGARVTMVLGEVLYRNLRTRRDL
jgi:hypothetical protein